MDKKISHLDNKGNIQMVDVGEKTDSNRRAVAECEIVMKPETIEAVESGKLKKGNVYTTAQLAGIIAAKRTAELIPLCHPLNINHISVDLKPDFRLPGIKISASVETIGKTGVEMEALTAVTLAALTVYDMVKSIDKLMRIQNIRLVEKTGGQSANVVNT